MRYLIVVLFFMCSNLSNAQNYEEVVYLNNGSIIRGIIIEFVPSQTIKIQSREGNIFVYNLSEIQKITKEFKVETKLPIISNTVSPQYNPGMSFLWSFILPGGGQFYNDQNGKGILMLGIHLASVSSMFYGLSDTEYIREGTDYWGNPIYNTYWSRDGELLFGFGLFFVTINSIWSIIDAPVVSKKLNRINNSALLNFRLNNSLNIGLNPTYNIGFHKGNFSPILGATVYLKLN